MLESMSPGHEVLLLPALPLSQIAHSFVPLACRRAGAPH